MWLLNYLVRLKRQCNFRNLTLSFKHTNLYNLACSYRHTKYCTVRGSHLQFSDTEAVLSIIPKLSLCVRNLKFKKIFRMYLNYFPFNLPSLASPGESGHQIFSTISVMVPGKSTCYFRLTYSSMANFIQICSAVLA